MAKTLLKNKAMMMEEVRKFVTSGKTVTITVKGYSMNPFLVHLRDTITLGAWKDEDIRKGCVALVKDNNDNYLIHRVIKREENIILLMGDGNIGQIETATIDNVIAIMYDVVRNGHRYTPDSFVWKVYSWFWMTITPFRRYPLAIWRRLNKQKPL